MKSAFAGPLYPGAMDISLHESLPTSAGSRSLEASEQTLRLVHDLGLLGARARQLEEHLGELETSSSPSMAALQSSLEGLGEDARQVLAEVCDCQDAEEGEEGKVGDLAFCALVELRVSQDRFSRGMSSLSRPTLAAEAGSLLHNLKRALTAVQAALCKDAGLKPTLSLAPELALALEVRVAYAKFRRDIEEIASTYRPEEGDAGAALCSAATSIAKLVGRDVFRKLWPQDRLQLYALQERILAWRAEALPDPWTARRLWQDLYGCAQILQQVNRRQELAAHDRRVLEEIEEMVALAPSVEAVRGRLVATASRLAGRDAALDALLQKKADTDEILAALRGLWLTDTGAGL